MKELLAQVPAADREAAKTSIPAILDAARANGITDPNQVAYLLATAKTESNFGARMVEISAGKKGADGVDTEFEPYLPDGPEGSALGNTEKGDAAALRGRGYVQVTGRGAYERTIWRACSRRASHSTASRSQHRSIPVSGGTSNREHVRVSHKFGRNVVGGTSAAPAA